MKSTSIWGIKVRFKRGSVWSMPYSYKSMKYYPKDEIVIVPVEDWYSIAKVVASRENPEFSLDINYKWIIGSITELKEIS